MFKYLYIFFHFCDRFIQKIDSYAELQGYIEIHCRDADPKNEVSISHRIPHSRKVKQDEESDKIIMAKDDINVKESKVENSKQVLSSVKISKAQGVKTFLHQTKMNYLNYSQINGT